MMKKGFQTQRKSNKSRNHDRGGSIRVFEDDSSKYAVTSLADEAKRKGKIGKKQRDHIRFEELQRRRKLSEPLILHPSWSARRQLLRRIHLARFKGKITKFDDYGEAVLRLHRGKAKLLKELDTAENQRRREDEERQKSEAIERRRKAREMHPSWQAKKKIKWAKQRTEEQQRNLVRDALSSGSSCNQKIRFN